MLSTNSWRDSRQRRENRLDWRDLQNAFQAVLFDLDGTLRYNRPSSVQVFLDYAVRLGAPDSPTSRQRAIRWTHYYWAQSAELLEDVQTYPESDDLFWMNYAWRHLIAFNCQPEDAAELAPKVHRYMKEEHKPEDWVPPDVPATLQALKDAGYRLGVLSNRTQPCDQQLEQLGLLGYFEFALVAGQVEAWKPEPQIFHHALGRLGTAPEQTLYVGDNYYADVIGAQRAGLQPILIDSDGIFPEAACPVIHSLGDLRSVLGINGSTPA